MIGRVISSILLASKKTLARWTLVVLLLAGVAVTVYMHVPRAGTTAFSKEYKLVLTDYQGQTVRFDTFQYKPLVVFFWATWCPYCKSELTHLSALKAQYGEQVNIVAVNRGESVADAKAYTDALALPAGLTYLLDANDVLFKDLGAYAMPETIFINSRGEQVVHQHGPMSPADADAAMQKIGTP